MPVIHKFTIAGPVLRRKYSLATFVEERLEWTLVHQSPEQSDTECLWVDVTGYKMVDVYKLPSSQFKPAAIPTFSHPRLHVGDFNCQHVNRGYINNISRRWEPGLMDRSQQPLSSPQPNGRSQFNLSPMEHRHQPWPGLRKCQLWQPNVRHRAGLSKWRARLEALLRGPTQWRVQKFWGGSSNHNDWNHEWCER